MTRKKIILSFDYELFFGYKSGTVRKSLIEPTNLLLDGMDKYGFKGNFFVDWQMLKYLKLQSTERTISDYNLIVSQLKDIVRRGHRIELHIHPHWVNAKYNNDGTWDFSDYSHYSLNSFSQEEIMQMFVEGMDKLTEIARSVDPHYDICAFRAGGWAVQPFDKLRKAYQAVGLKIDSIRPAATSIIKNKILVLIKTSLFGQLLDVHCYCSSCYIIETVSGIRRACMPKFIDFRGNSRLVISDGIAIPSLSELCVHFV